MTGGPVSEDEEAAIANDSLCVIFPRESKGKGEERAAQLPLITRILILDYTSTVQINESIFYNLYTKSKSVRQRTSKYK
jgi:hypothetical protein